MRRLAIGLTVLGLVMGGEASYGQAGTQPATQAATRSVKSLGIVISPETTGLTGPLREDGMVDYVAALNGIYGKGVTPQNNAAVLLVKISGTESLSYKYSNVSIMEQTLKMMGVTESVSKSGVFQRAPELTPPKSHLPDEFRGSRGNRKKEEIPPEWVQFRKEQERFREAASKPWVEADYPEVAAWLKTNEEAMLLAEQASERPRFWYPLVAKNPQVMPLSSVASSPFYRIRDTSAALRTRAMAKLGKGDAWGCWSDLRITARLARLLYQDSEYLTYGAALGIQDAAYDPVLVLVQADRLSVAQLLQVLTEVRSWEQIPEPGVVVGRVTPYKYAEAICEFARTYDEALAGKRAEMEKEFGKAGLPVPDWNRMLHLGRRFYDDYCGSSEGLSAEQKAARDQRVKTTLEAAEKVYDQVSENEGGLGANGKALERLMLPREKETQAEYTDRIGLYLLMDPALCQTHWELCHRHWEMTVVGCALAIYKAEHGQYPDRLNALVPGILPKVPVGAVERPIVYQKVGKGYRLTSVKAVPTTAPTTATGRRDFDNLIIEADR